SQIDYVTEICSCHCWAYGSAAHCQTCLRKFDAFAISQHSKATLDVELRHYRPEARLDLVRFEPALIELLELFQICFLFSQKALRNDPTLVRRQCFGANKGDGAALVVFANSFACACSADTRTNNDIIASNHIRNFDHNFSGGAPTSEIVKGPEVCPIGRPPTSLPAPRTSAPPRERHSRKLIERAKSFLLALWLFL